MLGIAKFLIVLVLILCFITGGIKLFAVGVLALVVVEGFDSASTGIKFNSVSRQSARKPWDAPGSR